MDAANMTSPQELRSPYNAKLAASAAHVANAPNDSDVQAFAWPTSLDSTFDEGTGTGTTSSNTHSGGSPSHHASDDYSMDDDESQSLEVALHPTSSSSSSRPVSSTRSMASASPLSHHRSESTASNSTGGGGGGATSLPSKLDNLMPFGTGDSKRHTMASVNTTLSAPELHSPPESDDDSFPYDATSTSAGSSLRAPRPASTGARRSQRFNSTGSSSATSSSKHHHHHGGAASSSSSSRRETTPVWKTRHKCTPDQQRQLLAFFDANRNPKGKVRQELADQLGMPERSVQIWFQNRRARVRKLCKSYGIDEDSPRAALLILQRRGVAPAAAPVTVKKKSSSNGSSNVVAKKKSITLSIKPKQQQHHQSRSSSHHSPSTTHLNDVAAVLATHDSQPGPQSQVASRPAVDEDYDKCSSPGSSDEEDEEEELRRRRSLWEACQDIVGEPRAKLKANPDEARTSTEQQAQQQQQPQSPVSKPSRLSTGSSSKAERSSSSRSGEVARQSSKSKLSADGTLSVTQLPAFSLCIATWRRVSPLTCFFSRRLHRLSWTLKADSVGFRIDLPYTSIKSLAFSGPVRPSMAELAEGISEPLGLLRVDLEKQPQFYMETFRSADPVDEADALVQNRWRQTEDFTEGNQGTHCLTHVLSGPFEPLRAAVEALRASDANIGDRLVMYDSMPAAGGGGSVEMVDAAGASNSAVPMAAFDDAAAASTSSNAAASTDLGGPPPLLRQQDWQHHPHQPSFIGPVASYGGEVVGGQFGYSTTGSSGGSGSHHREIHSSPLTASYELSYQHPHPHHHHHHQQQHQQQQQNPHMMPYSHYATARPGTSDSAVSLIGGDDTFSSVRAQLGHHGGGGAGGLGFSPGPRYQQAQQQGQQQYHHAAGPHSVDLHSYGSAHDLHAQQQQHLQQQQHHPPSAPPTLASLWSTEEDTAPTAGSHVVPLTVSGDMLSASSHHHGFAPGPGSTSGGHSPLSISSNSRRPSAPTLLTGGHGHALGGTGSLETSPGPTSASSLNAALAFGSSQDPQRRASATSSGSGGGGGVWDRPPPMTLLAQRQAALQAAAQAHAQQQQQATLQHQAEQDSVMLHSPQ